MKWWFLDKDVHKKRQNDLNWNDTEQTFRYTYDIILLLLKCYKSIMHVMLLYTWTKLLMRYFVW